MPNVHHLLPTIKCGMPTPDRPKCAYPTTSNPSGERSFYTPPPIAKVLFYPSQMLTQSACHVGHPHSSLSMPLRPPAIAGSLPSHVTVVTRTNACASIAHCPRTPSRILRHSHDTIDAHLDPAPAYPLPPLPFAQPHLAFKMQLSVPAFPCLPVAHTDGHNRYPIAALTPA